MAQEVYFPDGMTIDLCENTDQQRRELDKLGPETWEEFQRFMTYSKKLCSETEAGYFAKGLDDFWDLLRLYGATAQLAEF